MLKSYFFNLICLSRNELQTLILQIVYIEALLSSKAFSDQKTRNFADPCTGH